MKPAVILDTGPLVAVLSERDAYHDWITQQVTVIQSPLLTCEAVLTEACFLLRKHFKTQAVIEMVSQNLISVPFHLSKKETEAIKKSDGKIRECPHVLRRCWFSENVGIISSQHYFDIRQ